MNPDALYKLTHGMYVLGAMDGKRPVGSLVDAVMQAASSPWAIAISCGNNSYTKSCIEKTGEFSLSVLSKEVNPFVVANFGFQSSRNVDKWAKAEYYMKNNLPYLRDSLAVFRFKVLQAFPLISNTVFVAEVTEAEINQKGIPLTYSDYRSYFKQKVLDSFQLMQQSKGANMTDTKKWVCTVCGYVYDGDIPFENLPDDYVCPVCGVGKELFVSEGV